MKKFNRKLHQKRIDRNDVQIRFKGKTIYIRESIVDDIQRSARRFDTFFQKGSYDEFFQFSSDLFIMGIRRIINKTFPKKSWVSESVKVELHTDHGIYIFEGTSSWAQCIHAPQWTSLKITDGV